MTQKLHLRKKNDPYLHIKPSAYEHHVNRTGGCCWKLTAHRSPLLQSSVG